MGATAIFYAPGEKVAAGILTKTGRSSAADKADRRGLSRTATLKNAGKMLNAPKRRNASVVRLGIEIGDYIRRLLELRLAGNAECNAMVADLVTLINAWPTLSR